MEKQPAMHRRRKILGLAALAAALLGLTSYGVFAYGGPGVFLPLIIHNYKACGFTPTLTYPTESTSLDTLIPQFTGDAGQDASGRYVSIQVALDPEFKHIARTATSNTTTGSFTAPLMGNLEPGITYYWRAQLVCSSFTGPFSAVASFSTPSLVTLPPAVTLSQPTDSAVDVIRPVYFSWESLPDAQEYLVYFKASGPHGWYIVTTNQNNLVRNLSPGTVYEWYVMARSASGFGPETAHRSFTTAQ